MTYENWLNSDVAKTQLVSLANFVGRSCTEKQQKSALELIRPEFNHGGVDQLPHVDIAVRRAHLRLIKPGIVPKAEARRLECYSVALEINRLHRALRERLHLYWLKTPCGRHTLEAVIDKATLYKQIGTTSLKSYRQNFRQRADLRLHPLISPEHLNQERANRGLKPIKNSNELFRHLLYPDMLPLNTHPFFDCREYMKQNGQLGQKGEHPVLNYLRTINGMQKNQLCKRKIQTSWLVALGAHLDRSNEKHLPEIISRLHPGLILADPITTLGKPSSGKKVSHRKCEVLRRDRSVVQALAGFRSSRTIILD